ncbi:unnamed protein product, partial [Adineta steineri]
MNYIQGVILSNCPLLHSSTDNNGILIVNKSDMIYTKFPINCQWLIASSPHQKILIEFDYVFIPISTKEYLHTGCHRGSISLWTVGLQHEKIEICGDQRNIHIGGIGQILMIELRIIDSTLDVNFQCGLTWTNANHYYREIKSRIVGGRQAIPYSHPWQVLLNNRGHYCGASILNTKWLVTAAHCVNGTNPESLLAEFGMHDRHRRGPWRVARTIKQILVYPSYSGKSTRWVHDIALLRLSEPLVFNPFIRSICLPSVHDIIKYGERTLVTG